ncbi:MAG TPA: hypothetical protein VNM14_09710 [Planctomycetota bacterium]|jgi:hypothetical protein|nr:hypothetical protein [Planctomycetota bacterium]
MLIAAVLCSALVQEIENPEYKGWKSFKPGSSVTYKFTREGSPQSGEQKMTLKSIDDNEAVVTSEFTMAGKNAGKPSERSIKAKLAASDPRPELKDGPEEEIEVAGKMLKCRTRELEKKLESGKTMKVKYWGHEDIPGMAAKVETSTEGGMKITMVASQWEKK